jgi:hypothetical protein
MRTPGTGAAWGWLGQSQNGKSPPPVDVSNGSVLGRQANPLTSAMSDGGVAALLEGVDLDAAQRNLEGVPKPVVKASVLNATLRDQTEVLRRVVQVCSARITCGRRPPPSPSPLPVRPPPVGAHP